MYKKIDLFFGFTVIAIFIWFLSMLVSSFLKEDILSYKIKASFTSADGINVGSNIKIAGVNVGEVVNISINKVNYKAEVIMKIYTKIKIPTDSSASIQSTGFIGTKYIALNIGSEDIFIKDGESINYTQSSINLEKLISSFASNIGNKN